MDKFTDYCGKVNVFQGCDTINLPTAERLAASWYFIKGIAGNTSPGATLPFGKYSCCAYTSGYPQGYGNNYPNSCSWDLRHLKKEEAGFRGLSHFCQSGTGAIGWYYNFAVITPFMGDAPLAGGSEIINEFAEPGYYSVLSGGEILSETTVSGKSAYHRFTFPKKGGKFVVDFGNNGTNKMWPDQCGVCNSAELVIVSDTEVKVHVVMDGIDHYFRLTFDGAKVTGLMRDGKPVDGKELTIANEQNSKNVVFGIYAEAARKNVLTRFADSLKNDEMSERDVHTDEGDFDTVAALANATWEKALRRIEIEGADERNEEIFYSNFYHSLVKPCDRRGESPLWDEDGFIVDICTMWDIYKTELPLVFSLYPEVSERIMEAFFLYAKYEHKLPHTLLMGDHFATDSCSGQACLIGEHSVCDAFWRGVKGDYKANLPYIMDSIHRPSYAGLLKDEVPTSLTHLLDVAEACGDVADMAEALGEKETADSLRAAEARWKEAYDPATGLLRKEGFNYYEGNHVNYSFRLLRHMDERVALAGGKEKYKALLDKFFGFTNPYDASGRFEGFNNESDMETPFAYHAIGAMDRIADITNAAADYMFVEGRGGIPGNNDSGGMSSCYMWLVMGIFPAAGQNKMMVGFPRFPKVTMHLASGKDFVIERVGEGDVVVKAELDGEVLINFEFTASRMMQGGVLKLTLGKRL